MKTKKTILILAALVSAATTFAQDKVKVEIENTEGGTFTISPEIPSDGMVAKGTVFTVTAKPEKGYVFDCAFQGTKHQWGTFYNETNDNPGKIVADHNITIGAAFLPESNFKDIEVTKNVVYAKPGKKELKYDVYAPKKAKSLPIVVIVHGGGWSSNVEDIMRGMGREIAKSGRKILFVATKKQAQEVVAEKAKAVGMPYVTERWAGGMLTNFPTIRKAVKKMTTIDKMMTDGTFENISKREKLQITRQREKLEKNLGSIADLTRLPSAIFVVDVMKEHIAVREAQRLGIPVFAIVDTNSNPNGIDYVIPANDDATKSIDVILTAVCEAIQEGLDERKVEKADAEAAETPATKERKSRVSKKAKTKKEDGEEETVAAETAEEAEATEEAAETTEAAAE